MNPEKNNQHPKKKNKKSKKLRILLNKIISKILNRTQSTLIRKSLSVYHKYIQRRFIVRSQYQTNSIKKVNKKRIKPIFLLRPSFEEKQHQLAFREASVEMIPCLIEKRDNWQMHATTSKAWIAQKAISSAIHQTIDRLLLNHFHKQYGVTPFNLRILSEFLINCLAPSLYKIRTPIDKSIIADDTNNTQAEFLKIEVSHDKINYLPNDDSHQTQKHETAKNSMHHDTLCQNNKIPNDENINYKYPVRPKKRSCPFKGSDASRSKRDNLSSEEILASCMASFNQATQETTMANNFPKQNRVNNFFKQNTMPE